MAASLRWAGVCAVAWLLAGCPSTTVYRTADPVAPGAWQLGGSLGLGVMRDSEQDSRLPTGHLELSARRGIAPDLDMGGKLYVVGMEVNATWRIARRGVWSYAIAPQLGGVRTAETPATVDAINLFAGGAFIASRPLSKRWTIGTGPLAGWGLYWPETGGSAQGAWVGAFVHGDARVWKRWHVTPELGLYRVFAGEVPVHGSAIQLGAALRRDL